MEHPGPIKMDDLYRGTPILGHPHNIYIYIRYYKIHWDPMVGDRWRMFTAKARAEIAQ